MKIVRGAMAEIEFEEVLACVCRQLTTEARSGAFKTAKIFEDRVREVVQESLQDPLIAVDFDPHPQAFPDIAVGEFGIPILNYRALLSPIHRIIYGRKDRRGNCQISVSSGSGRSVRRHSW